MKKESIVKKLLIALLVFVSVILMSCTKQIKEEVEIKTDINPNNNSITEKLDVQEVGGIVDSVEYKATYEIFPYSTLDYIDEKAPKKMIVEFMDKSYTGEYIRSDRPYITHSYIIDYYKSDQLLFEINRTTKELCSVSMGNDNRKYDMVYSKEELYEMACDCFELNGIDPKHYSLKIEEYQDDPAYYTYILTRKVGRTDTVGAALIRIDNYGNIWDYHKNMIDEIENSLTSMSEKQISTLTEIAETQEIIDLLTEETIERHKAAGRDMKPRKQNYLPKIVLINGRLGVYYIIEGDLISKDPTGKDIYLLDGTWDEYVVFPKNN